MCCLSCSIFSFFICGGGEIYYFSHFHENDDEHSGKDSGKDSVSHATWRNSIPLSGEGESTATLLAPVVSTMSLNVGIDEDVPEQDFALRE